MSQTFCLFPEPVSRPTAGEAAPTGTGTPSGTANGASRWLDLPEASRSYLSRSGDGEPRISSHPPAGGGWIAAFEPLRHERRLYLAMVSAPGARLRLNGSPPPPLAILKVRDQIRIEGDRVLHVSLYTRPYFGPPTQEHAGKECALCLTVVKGPGGSGEDPEPGKESTIYSCPRCAAVLHARAWVEGEKEPLECVKLSSSCPSCHHPIVRREGHAYTPEL